MLKLVMRRLAWSVPLVVVASMVSFVLMAFLPGDAARSLLGPNATEDQLVRARQELGLDRPLWSQYTQWLGDALRGDLGSSLISRQSVTDLLNERLAPSLSLIVGAVLLGTVVGITLGVRGARGGRVGKVVQAGSTLGLALPDFWLALMLVVVFAVNLGVLPPTGYIALGDDPSGWLRSLVLPVVTLAVPVTAVVAKQARDAMATALERSFVRTLRAAGVSERAVVWRHALKNAAIPILTVVGIVFVGALSGTIAVEFIFAIPGLGSAAVQATASHDLPVIQGVVMYFTGIVVIVNLAVDVAYGFLDPRASVS